MRTRGEMELDAGIFCINNVNSRHNGRIINTIPTPDIVNQGKERIVEGLSVRGACFCVEICAYEVFWIASHHHSMEAIIFGSCLKIPVWLYPRPRA